MDYLAAMRSFVRAVELGSFSRAAEEAGVKVSTVSRYVTGLEADLGAALLNRSTRSLHPTEAGRAFYDRSVRVLQEVEEARVATRSLNAMPQGLLRVAMPGAFGRRHVMPQMASFLAANREVRLDATIVDTPIDLIEFGIDIAVRIGTLADSTLIAKRLSAEIFVLVGSPDYLDRRAPPGSPSDVSAYECLLSEVVPSKAWFFRPAGDTNAVPKNVDVGGRIRSNDLEVLRTLVLAGQGISLLPTWLCDADLRSGQMLALLPDWDWFPTPATERAIWGVYPPKRIVSPKVKTFLSFLSERYGTADPWLQDSENTASGIGQAVT